VTIASVGPRPISPISRRPESRSNSSVGAACRSDWSAIVCRVRPVQVCLLIGWRAPALVSCAARSSWASPTVARASAERRHSLGSVVRCRWLRLSAVIAGLAVAFGAVAVTSASAATGVPVWPAASKLALPSDANTAEGGQETAVESVACTGPGNCVAVGYYTDTNGGDDRQAMVLSSVASLAVSTTGLSSVVAGSAYSAQLSATGGRGATHGRSARVRSRPD